MSCTAPRLLRVFVCACAIGGVVELLAESPHPDRRRSSHATDSSILERLPIDFIRNTGRWQTPRGSTTSSSATIGRSGNFMHRGIEASPIEARNASVTANVQ